jgi:hypothetical protein
MKQECFAITLLIALTTGAKAAPSQYLCIVEHAAGLHYDKQANAWIPQAFGTGGKYILRKLNDDDRDQQKGKWWRLLTHYPNANWALFEFAKDMPMPLVACVEDAGGFSKFNCQRVIYDGSFDKDSRRFELVLHGGYMDQGFWEQFRREHPQSSGGTAHDPSNPDDHYIQPDDLYVEIGNCSPS